MSGPSKAPRSTSATTAVALSAASILLLAAIYYTRRNGKTEQQDLDHDNDEGDAAKPETLKNKQIERQSGRSIYENIEKRVGKFEKSQSQLSSSSQMASSLPDESLPPIPSHLEREDWKERRRVKMLPLLAMKKPMYDNVRMMDPQGEVLCTISAKKGRWYVERNLADWTNPETKTCIKLRFEPKNRSTRGEKGLYNRSDKKNACVSCGDDKYHMRHYVVPYAYRTLLPNKYKTHLSHDIVILCPNCHLHCERERQLRMNEMEEQLRRPDDEPQFRTDRQLYHVRSCALALLRSRNKLPEKKRVEYETLVRKHLNLSTTTPEKGDDGHDVENKLTNEQLQKAIDVQYQIENLNYIPGPNLVVQSLRKDDKKIASFIRGWRHHFLETAKPRFLPTGWSVDSPVVCGTD